LRGSTGDDRAAQSAPSTSSCWRWAARQAQRVATRRRMQKLQEQQPLHGCECDEGAIPMRNLYFLGPRLPILPLPQPPPPPQQQQQQASKQAASRRQEKKSADLHTHTHDVCVSSCVSQEVHIHPDEQKQNRKRLSEQHKEQNVTFLFSKRLFSFDCTTEGTPTGPNRFVRNHKLFRFCFATGMMAQTVTH